MSDDQIKLQEVYEWMQERKNQQLVYPLDEASKNALGAVLGAGASNLTTTTNVPIVIGSTPYSGSIGVARTPTGFLTIQIDGAQYVIAYYT